MNMDIKTLAFYQRYAEAMTDTSEARRSAMISVIERAVPIGASVLDVGAGSGRDVAAMLELGLDAFAVEPSDAMRAKALTLYPSLQGRLRSAMLPLSGNPFADIRPEGFDAVVCSAVLMHIDIHAIQSALASMVGVLCPATATDGMVPAALLLSVPFMEPSRLQGDRDFDGRRFHNHDLEHLRALLEDLGMELESAFASDAVIASTGTLWQTLVFRRRQ